MIEEILQYDRRRRGVQPSLPPAPVRLTSGEAALGLEAREPLILKMHRQSGVTTQRLDKAPDIHGLIVRLSAQGPRQADHHTGQPVVLTFKDRNLAGNRDRPLLRCPGDREDP